MLLLHNILFKKPNTSASPTLFDYSTIASMIIHIPHHKHSGIQSLNHHKKDHPDTVGLPRNRGSTVQVYQ